MVTIEAVPSSLIYAQARIRSPGTRLAGHAQTRQRRAQNLSYRGVSKPRISTILTASGRRKYAREGSRAIVGFSHPFEYGHIEGAVVR